MGTIFRPTKGAGTTQYQTEVAAGKPDIIDAEVDGDLDTIYGEFNGGIDNANIDSNAAISYSKLNLTGQIKASDLVPGTFTNNPIVDTGGLVIDATTQFFAQVGTSLTLPYGLTTTDETIISTITASPPSRGGLIWMIGNFSGWFGAPGPEVGLIGRIRLGGTVGVADGSVVGVSQVLAQATGSTHVFPFQINCISLPRGTAGGTGPIKLTAQLTQAGGAYAGTTANIRDAQLIAFELA